MAMESNGMEWVERDGMGIGWGGMEWYGME